MTPQTGTSFYAVQLILLLLSSALKSNLHQRSEYGDSFQKGILNNN